jgi:hypothetical protein
VHWSSKSVRELKAFLRSRGGDLRGLIEKDDLVQAATPSPKRSSSEPSRGGERGIVGGTCVDLL